MRSLVDTFIQTQGSPMLISIIGQQPWRVTLGCVMGLWLAISGCTSDSEHQRYIVDSPLVPFDDLFSLKDTVHLDPSIVVGGVSFLDENSDGHLLVGDRILNAVHLFDASGIHRGTFSPTTCLPEKSTTLGSARFVEGGRILYVALSGPMVLFDAAGACLATEVGPDVEVVAACAGGDTLYALPAVHPFKQANVIAYSLDLKRLGSRRIEEPEFSRLNRIDRGTPGRQIECFGDGPYYKYLEWEDARPVRSYDSLAQLHPEFFTKRTQKLPRNVDLSTLIEATMAYPTNSGVYGIDGRTRLVLYRNLPNRRSTDSLRYVGLGVISNFGDFPPRSTLSDGVPVGAANGYVYSVGDNEPLPDGDIGNPVILRYKFIPPADAAP